jgi:hypothetical protein
MRLKETYIVSTPDPSSFATRFRDMLAAVTKLAADDELDDTTRSSLDVFFPDCSMQESRARVARYRRMTHGQRAESEVTERWSLDNLVYRLRETKDEWSFVDIEVIDATTVTVVIDAWEAEYATGIVRQLTHCAGGVFVDDVAVLAAISIDPDWSPPG